MQPGAGPRQAGADAFQHGDLLLVVALHGRDREHQDARTSRRDETRHHLRMFVGVEIVDVLGHHPGTAPDEGHDRVPGARWHGCRPVVSHDVLAAWLARPVLNHP